MKIEHVDRTHYFPTMTGPHGEAWEVNVEQVRRLTKLTEEDDSTVALFVVFAPWAHPWWAYYVIGAIHLRPQKKLPAPKIMLPGATHEILVYALSPDVAPDVVDTSKLQKLTPINFAGQWTVQERPNPVDLDRAAAQKVKRTVEEILAGELSPDTDFRSEWVKRFSDSNIHR